MKFELWSFGHIIFMLSPAIIFIPLYFYLRRKSENVKYFVGIVIGIISLLILLIRNIDIYVHRGFDPEIIPLQVCHFGNILVFISLIFKNKASTALLFSLNMLCAYSSLVFADSLANYSTIFCVRAQAYIWGHIFIVLGALYAVFIMKIKLTLKDYFYALIIGLVLLVPSIILNSYFRNVLGKDINYFYIYDSSGVPFDFIFKWGKQYTYGWFKINYVYTFSLMIIFGLITFGIFESRKLFKKLNN